MSDKPFEDQLDFYPYGVQYHRAPTPRPDEWTEDLAEIARIGYTHIQLRPQWRWHERARGKPVWDDLDKLFDLAKKNKLRVILKPMLETAPDWVFGELNGKRIGFHGVPIDPIAHGAYYVGGWWPCFDNPQVIKAARQFVRLLVKRYRNHPALWLYDAWNEPISRPLGQCQCLHSVRSYRKWLERRFKTIGSLNEKLGKAWTSFGTIQPPASGTDYTEMFLWRQWAAYAVAEQVRFVSETIREIDPKAFIMVHVGGSSIVQDPICGTSDDMLNAATTDRYGTSFGIPLHPKTPVECAAPDYQSDWLRRIDSMYWCHEFYPNRGKWCRPPEPYVLNRLVWMAIAGGCAGFTFWQFRSERVGNETNESGLREIDGSPTARSEVTDSIAGILARHGKRLVGTKRIPSRLAMLYNRQSDMIGRIEIMSPYWNEISIERGNDQYPYKWALKKAHALYLQTGEPVDWIVSGDDIGKYRLLHVTCNEMIDGKTADWLRGYVYEGGTLIVEFPFACRDENTWVSQARPSHGLKDLLGCREGSRIVTGDGYKDVATIEPLGLEVQVRQWRIELIPEGGKVIAKWQDGSAAGIQHDYGKGKVYCFGVNLALASNDSWDDPLLAIWQWFLKRAGVKAWPWTGDRRVWIRRRRGKDREIWFVFNLNEESRNVSLPAQPRTVWQENGCSLHNLRLKMAAGATWIAELPIIKDYDAK
jgi:beta-galactosidase